MRRFTLALAAVAALAVWFTMSASAGTRQVPLGGTASPQTGDFTPSGAGDVMQDEFPTGEESDEGPDPYGGTISFSTGAGGGVSVTSGKKAKSNPTFNFGFQGLNHYQQRFARGGNQFSVEPPDQGMCVGNGYVVEAVNDVLNVFSASTGASALPDNTATNIVSGFPRNVNHAVDLNSFYGYAPAINRTTGIRGQFVTDPSCLYDAATQRFFVVVLTLEVVPTSGAFTTVNHLDLAVSQTSNPTGSWNIYRIDVTNDGTNTGGANPGPFLGDYPHIGADANGIFLTTNAYPWCCNGFSGAQIYALSKAALAAGAATVDVTHLDTSGMVNAPSDAGSTQPGFTLWPSQSPGTSQFSLANNGTEYFLSSNAADEAQKPVSGSAGTRTSNQLIVWTLSNTASLNTATPALGLSNKILTVGQYGVPPKQHQQGAGTAPDTTVPQGHCLNDETTQLFNGQFGCWRLLVGATAHAQGAEVVASPDSNDTRMQQVMYANGKLWGALDTALNPDAGPQRAGIAWYIVNPSAGSIVKSGYLGATGYDFTYPAIGVTASGRGVMAFTASGDALHPSAAYAPIDASVGVGAWNVVTGGTGAAADDGFSGYKQTRFPNPIRSRWGDYGAAAVDGNSVWIASEYIGGSCNYTDYGGPFFAGGTGDNILGTCGGASHGPGPRSASANWSTRISKLTP
ncbi:MAG TPA: hypothetical protein VF101_03420 [Gaiellaceae bacterium]